MFASQMHSTKELDRPYQYEPLPKPTCRYYTVFKPGQPEKRKVEVPLTTYIRLATLEPAAQPHDDLVIRLDTVPFEAPFSDFDYEDASMAAWSAAHAIVGDDPPSPKYEALSYAWGSDANPSRVRVRSQRHKQDPHNYYLSITRNLHDALCALRKYHLDAEDPEGDLVSSLSRVLWVDAICIDQYNAAEKGPQVAMMGDIYRSASRVVAWLGPSDDTSHRAMRYMCSVGLQVNVSFRGSELSPAPGAADPTLGDIQVPLFETHDQDMATCLTALLGRAWFSRLWVVQEILLGNPSRTVVLCGPRDAVPWSLFRKAIAVVSWKWSNMITHQDIHAHIAVMSRLRTFVTVQESTAYLSRLRYDFGALTCKDPHDRVYAVLNLLGPLERRHLRIRPDYDMPVARLYRGLVRRSIGVLGDLTILEECEANAEGDRSLPSWVPDWHAQSASRMSTGGAHATAQLAGWTKSNDILDDSSDILILSGVSISTIQHIGTSYPDDINADYFTLVAQMLFQEGLWDIDRPWDVHLCEWVRTLLTGEVAEDLYPLPQWAPTMGESVETLRVMLNMLENGPLDPDEWESGMSQRFLRNAGNRIAGRRICKDSRGSLVLAPPLARRGDLVCVLLGSDAHVLLRPVLPTGEQFRLVGTCFAHCALSKPGTYLPTLNIALKTPYRCHLVLTYLDLAQIDGTAILGPLPPEFRIISNPRTSNMAFVSVETGQRTLVDPRLSYVFSEEELAKFESSLSDNGDSPQRLQEQIDPEILSKWGRGLDGTEGVNIRKFEII